MPEFSADPVTDYLVTEGVIRSAQEAKREATEKAEQEAKNKEKIEGHRTWAEEAGVLEHGGPR